MPDRRARAVVQEGAFGGFHPEQMRQCRFACLLGNHGHAENRAKGCEEVLQATAEGPKTSRQDVQCRAQDHIGQESLQNASQGNEE